MEQKLYHLAVKLSGNSSPSQVIDLPDDLEDLLEAGWIIAQVSAYTYGTRGVDEKCVLLLQRSKEK